MICESTIYVVDSDQEMSRSLAALLGMYDIQVTRFAEAEDFFLTAQPSTMESGCLLIDLEQPGADSTSMLHRLRAEHPGLPVIAMGQGLTDDARREAREAGATDFIDKSLVGAYLFHRLAELVPGADKLPHTEPSIMEMSDGKQVTFRMTHPDDARIQQAFISALSDRSRYMRFFSGLQQLPAHILKEFTTPIYPVSYAVVAIIPDGDGERQIGVARWAPTGTDGIAEFAVVVADDCQGQGIASRLMQVLIGAATLGGLHRLEGLILKENAPMLAMVRKLGFTACSDHDAGPSVSMYIKDLREPADS